jgi:hypothetical protein
MIRRSRYLPAEPPVMRSLKKNDPPLEPGDQIEESASVCGYTAANERTWAISRRAIGRT